jgi:hypothetical protein
VRAGPAEPASNWNLQKNLTRAGTKPAQQGYRFKCSNLERGESMKDPVSILGCWRGFSICGRRGSLTEVQSNVGGLSGCGIEAFKRAPANALQHRLKTEGDQHLMMSQTLAAFYEPQVSYQAIAAAAHAREPAILESEHPARMHCPAIPSILDITDSVLFTVERTGDRFSRSETS